MGCCYAKQVEVTKEDVIDYKEMEFQKGHICALCSDKINRPATIMISADGKDYHPECFRCCNCDKQIDSKYEKMNTGEHKYICESCFNKKTLLTRPTCINCSKIIESGGLIVSSANLHENCFHCSICRKQFTQTSFFKIFTKPPTTQLLCESCYRRSSSTAVSGVHRRI